MAATTQISLLAKRRAQHWIDGFGGAFSNLIFQRFWSWQSQFLGNIDLQTVEFGPLTTTNVVINGASCTLYAVIVNKPTAVLNVLKMTNNATTCTTNGGQDISISGNTIGEYVLLFGKGYTLSTGLTIQCNTTPTGSSAPSTADQPSGVCVIGN